MCTILERSNDIACTYDTNCTTHRSDVDGSHTNINAAIININNSNGKIIGNILSNMNDNISMTNNHSNNSSSSSSSSTSSSSSSNNNHRNNELTTVNVPTFDSMSLIKISRKTS